MSDAALISITPKWVAMILNGKKTIEVRKTAPKLETPFKVYVYCTQDGKYKIAPFRFVEGWFVKKYDETTHYASGCSWNMKGELNGKVVAEFTCDRIEVYTSNELGWYCYDLETCLLCDEIAGYGKGKPLYGWHISDLKVYDQPKELSEFYKVGMKDFKQSDWTENHCDKHCAYAHDTPRYGYYSSIPISDDDDPCDKKRCEQALFEFTHITRPPQSWCYVEEIKE